MKIRKLWKKVVLTIIGAGVVYTLAMLTLIRTEFRNYPQGEMDTLLVLGAQVWGKSVDQAHPSPVFAERLDTAVDYLKIHPQTIAVVSGGLGRDEIISEASCAKKYLIQQGIDPKRIVLEDNSMTTLENLQNSQKLIHGQTALVTNDFHLYRAKLLAKRVGLKNIQGLPAVSKTSATPRLFAREIIAVGYYLFKK